MYTEELGNTHAASRHLARGLGGVPADALLPQVNRSERPCFSSARPTPSRQGCVSDAGMRPELSPLPRSGKPEAAWNSIQLSARGRGAGEAGCLRPRREPAGHHQHLSLWVSFYPSVILFCPLLQLTPSLATTPTLSGLMLFNLTLSRPQFCPNLMVLLELCGKSSNQSQSLWEPGPPPKRPNWISPAPAHF